jgi:alkanesulfonate monooxygenase SsuD/methylene tetrahydromethanopterin reductase-like flavin-dependent oxidoreductase (luciferase family)
MAHAAIPGGCIVTAGRRAVGVTPMETRRDVLVAAAVLADELGYEAFAVPEGWGLDSTPVVAEIILRTSQITVASAVLSVWGRTPATLAMTAATLHQMSAGRYVLGLGASTPALAEGFHDVPFAAPARRLRETVTSVRALLRGEPAPLHRVPAAYPLRLGQPPVPDLPVWVAALGPQSTALAAELGDGWIPALVARDQLPAWAARLRAARAAAVPDAGEWTVAAGPITVAAADSGEARQVAASCVAWYLSAMGGVYARSVSDQGYPAEVAAIVAANPRPSTRRGIIPPGAQEVLHQLAACGAGAEVREQVERWDDAADVTTILLPPGLPWPAIEATLRAAAPSKLALSGAH